MRTTIYTILFAVAAMFIASCKTRTVHVPVETVRTEYKDRYLRDSIQLYDSVFIDRWMKNDTIYLTKEKYKYLYRDRLKTDTLIRQDTIAVPYPVVETKEVNRLNSFQAFQIWCGRILLLAGILLIIQKIIRRKFNFNL